MKTKVPRNPTDATSRAMAEQARAELVALASEKLGRSLIKEEEEEIQRLGGEYLTSGYFAKLYSGYNARELLDWFSTVAETRKEMDAIRRRRDAITKQQLEQARAEVVQIATEKLGRALTRAEQEVVRGFDKSLLAGGDIAELFRGYTKQELAETFAKAGAGPGPVALLKSLAAGRFSLKASHERLLAFLDSKGRQVLAGFDLEEALEDFSKWFVDLLRTEPPGRKIRALYFGLFEAGSGCRLYVTGAKAYDKEDADWACASDWRPSKRYAPLDQLSSLWDPLEKAGNEPWVAVQAIAIIIVRDFFGTHFAEFRKLTGLNAIYIASGFDDGDLYALRTPLSRKA